MNNKPKIYTAEVSFRSTQEFKKLFLEAQSINKEKFINFLDKTLNAFVVKNSNQNIPKIKNDGVMNLNDILQKSADNYSKNKATNTAYIKIFQLIYLKNIILMQNNEYGYTEINCQKFKLISKRNYKDILIDLSKNLLIKSNMDIKNTSTGSNFKKTKRYIRGYKVDKDIKDYNFNFTFLNHNSSLLNLSKATKANKTYNSTTLLNPYNHPQHPIPVAILSTDGNKIQDKIKKQQLKIKDFEIKNIKIEGNIKMIEMYDLLKLDQSRIKYDKDSDQYKQLIKIWNDHKIPNKTGNRIYSWFHMFHNQERQWLLFNGSPLRELFDIPACNFVMLAKMLEKQNVDKEQLKIFQKLVRFQYIYEKIASYVNLDINEKQIKKQIKKSCQHWINTRKVYMHVGSWNDQYFNAVDQYFKRNFPSIAQIIINWHEEQYNGKTSKMIWNDFQKIQYEIISQKIPNMLFKRYGIISFTCHDAIYVSDNDKQKIDLDPEYIFWKAIDLKYV